MSRNMVKEYNYRAESRGIRSEDVFAIQGNIVDATESADLDKPDYFNFDVVVLNAALHHMENPALAVQRLANRLVPGKGVLVISDFIASEGSTGHDTVGKSANRFVTFLIPFRSTPSRDISTSIRLRTPSHMGGSEKSRWNECSEMLAARNSITTHLISRTVLEMRRVALKGVPS